MKWVLGKTSVDFGCYVERVTLIDNPEIAEELMDKIKVAQMPQPKVVEEVAEEK